MQHIRAKHLATDEKVYWFRAKHSRWSKQENNTHQDERVYRRRASILGDHRRPSEVLKVYTWQCKGGSGLASER